MANRSMAAKHDKGKRQTIALVQAEMSKACHMTRKPEVPAYDAAMVKRCDSAMPKARKLRYVPAPVKPLVRTGITVGSWDQVGTCRLIPRHR